MGNGASLGKTTRDPRFRVTSRWREDPSTIEEWQRQVEQEYRDEDGNNTAHTHRQQTSLIFNNQRPVNARVPVELGSSIDSTGGGRGGAANPRMLTVIPCPSQRLHFESTVKVYTVSSRPNFLQVCPWVIDVCSTLWFHHKYG